MTVYYHGSNAASFPGVFDKHNAGLRSLEVLFRERNPPFSGELCVGRKGISVVEKDCIAGAMRYVSGTFGGTYGWNPQQSQEQMEKKRKRVVCATKDMRSSMKEREWIERDYDLFVHIEQLREKRWQQLSEEDRELVQNPFPVLYAIQYKERVEYHKTDVPGDMVIEEERIPLQQITLFVPRDATERTKRRWEKVDENPRVLAFDWLTSIVNSIKYPRNKEDAERHLERLLGYKT